MFHLSAKHIRKGPLQCKICPDDPLWPAYFLWKTHPLMALNLPTSFYTHLWFAMDFEHRQGFFGSAVGFHRRLGSRICSEASFWCPAPFCVTRCPRLSAWHQPWSQLAALPRCVATPSGTTSRAGCRVRTGRGNLSTMTAMPPLVRHYRVVVNQGPFFHQLAPSICCLV